MKNPIVFNAGSYMVPLGVAMLVSTILLYRSLGIGPILVYLIVFYFLLSFANSIERGVIESRRRR